MISIAIVSLRGVNTGGINEDWNCWNRQRRLRFRHGRGGARQRTRNRSVNRTRKTAEAVATDIRYGVPVGRKVDLIDGDYTDLKDAGVVLVTSGVNEKTGGATDRNDPQGRLRLLGKNAEIYRDIVPKIVDAAPQAVLLVVTDPPDPLADIARETRPGATVLSAGTYLDSQRFRVHLGKHFGVDPAHVEAQVIGDHGTAQVFSLVIGACGWCSDHDAAQGAR
jgi:malate/lactate dehydrogenase